MTQAEPGDTNQDNDRRQSLDPEMFKKMQQMQELLPQQMKKADVEDLESVYDDGTLIKSENLTVEWIHAFLGEVQRVDDFFSKKQNELIDQFITLQDKFRIRTELVANQSKTDEDSSLVQTTTQGLATATAHGSS